MCFSELTIRNAKVSLNKRLKIQYSKYRCQSTVLYVFQEFSLLVLGFVLFEMYELTYVEFDINKSVMFDL